MVVHPAEGQEQEEVGIRKVDVKCHCPQQDLWILLPTPMETMNIVPSGQMLTCKERPPTGAVC